ncbi:MAG: septal ring lytic transglycosylase RlpA family protein [Bacteroidetes bacterium]|nr:septal ring lytic transglycosylase RlpA family protein [Bacteroidota bacterium]
MAQMLDSRWLTDNQDTGEHHMIITTRQFLSSIWLLIALIVATLLAVALPGTANAQKTAAPEFIAEGIASYYNLNLHGAKTTSGERYDHTALTAAHATLPLNSMVKVTSIENNLFVIVRINDRMKNDPKRIIDLSGAAAQTIGLFEAGITAVKLTLMEGEQLSLKPNANPVDRVSKASTSKTQPKVESTKPPGEPARKVSASTNEGSGSLKPAYTLQIGSFSTHGGAENLAKNYPEAWIDRIQSQSELSFRVYYGRFSDEKQARVAQNALWTKGQDSFLRKVGA